jgi:hypothetical protein
MTLKLDTACVDLLRALMPIVYVRTNDTDTIQQDYNDTMLWGVYGTTGDPIHPHPSLPTAEDSEVVRRNKIHVISEYKHQRRLVNGTPAEVIEYLRTTDPMDKQGLGVITINGQSTIESLAEPIRTFYSRRHTDFRWCCLLVFVGTLPAKEAVPMALWDLIFPVDLVDPKPDGVDTRPRPDAAKPEAMQAAFKEIAELAGMKPNPDFPDSPEMFEGLNGLTVFNMYEATALSIIHTRKVPEGDKNNAFKRMLNPATLDMYRNRWARVGEGTTYH